MEWHVVMVMSSRLNATFSMVGSRILPPTGLSLLFE